MKKRRFLQAIFAALGGGGATSQAVAPSTSPRRVVVQASPVAGFQYHAGDRLWALLRVGDHLALVREPDNPHDERAVRVEWNGESIGYVPRVEYTAVAQMLDRGEALHGRITALEESSNPWARVGFEVVFEV